MECQWSIGTSYQFTSNAACMKSTYNECLTMEHTKLSVSLNGILNIKCAPTWLPPKRSDELLEDATLITTWPPKYSLVATILYKNVFLAPIYLFLKYVFLTFPHIHWQISKYLTYFSLLNLDLYSSIICSKFSLFQSIFLAIT